MIKRVVIRDAERNVWLSFSQPIRVLRASEPADVLPVLAQLEQFVDKEQRYACGFLGYEAAGGIDRALVTRPPGRMPLLEFGVFAAPEVLEQLPETQEEWSPGLQWQTDTGREAYREAFAHIKEQIELGNSYQVNFSLRLASTGVVDPWQLFIRLAHDAPYAAFIESDEFAVVSASPELFFRLHDDELVCRPMKGTAARGMTFADDIRQRDGLRNSSKDQAENVMVTDMLRNDMGRVSQPGSVTLTSLYDIEKYPSVWQMTSTVSSTTQAGIAEIIAALFPCASITGAPKASSMRIIAQLETSPREIYTGSIGFIAPGRRAQFNVAIRTAWLDRASGNTTYGVGGGIVWDSDADAEYDECLTKSKVLQGHPSRDSFSLLETLRLERDGSFFLLDYHLQRLADSARYFDFTLDSGQVRAALDDLAARLDPDVYRVRLLVAADGRIDAQPTPYDSGTARRQTVRLARRPVDANDPFLYHKTTHRDVYVDAMQEAGDCDDVLLWNQDGYITETSIANVIRTVGGIALTPPVHCGLLAGTLRRQLLEQGVLREQLIHRDELASGEVIGLVNSVRGRYEAKLVS